MDKSVDNVDNLAKGQEKKKIRSASTTLDEIFLEQLDTLEKRLLTILFHSSTATSKNDIKKLFKDAREALKWMKK